MSVSGASCFCLTLFNLQGARRFVSVRHEENLNTSLSVCQALFSKFLQLLKGLFSFRPVARDSFYRIPPATPFVNTFFQIFSIFSTFSALPVDSPSQTRLSSGTFPHSNHCFGRISPIAFFPFISYNKRIQRTYASLCACFTHFREMRSYYAY